jgi:hypothetical protein
MDAILYDGVDPQAVWRTHLREVTMARQAAERRRDQRDVLVPQDRSARAATARARAEAFHVEMERINADHRRWQLERGPVAVELPNRGRKRAESRQAPANPDPVSGTASSSSD